MASKRQADLPERIQPTYRTQRVNASIPLHRGRATITVSQTGNAYEFTGYLRLEWSPRPALMLRLSSYRRFSHEALGVKTNRYVQVTLNQVSASFRIAPLAWMVRIGKRLGTKVEGIVVEPFTVGAARQLDYAILHLVNFHAYRGSPLRGGGFRVEWVTPEWRITIDEVPEFTKLRNQLRDGGYAITHVARVERMDGRSFRPKQLQSLLTPLGMFLSFVRGSWCVPILVVGFTNKHGRVWEMWETPDMFRIPSQSAVVSWFPEQHSDEVANLFGKFCGMWLSEKWQEVLRMALGYYFFANAPDADREPQLIVAQAALEMLAHAILVDEERALSTKGFDELSAADKIRLLQMWANIPKDIPKNLNMLTEAARQENWRDSAEVITGLRNLLAHPNRQKIRNYFSKPRGVAWGATQVALWCIELILLRLLGYEGVYNNRTKRGWAGEVEPVPWA